MYHKYNDSVFLKSLFNEHFYLVFGKRPYHPGFLFSGKGFFYSTLTLFFFTVAYFNVVNCFFGKVASFVPMLRISKNKQLLRNVGILLISASFCRRPWLDSLEKVSQPLRRNGVVGSTLEWRVQNICLFFLLKFNLMFSKFVFFFSSPIHVMNV